MEITRLYTDPEGETRFADVVLADGDAGVFARVPLTYLDVRAADRLTAGEEPHPCPRRQFVLVMASEVEVETSLGDVRRFAPGRVLFVEDLTGKGHRLRHVGPGEVRMVLLPVPDDWQCPPGTPADVR